MRKNNYIVIFGESAKSLFSEPLELILAVAPEGVAVVGVTANVYRGAGIV